MTLQALPVSAAELVPLQYAIAFSADIAEAYREAAVIDSYGTLETVFTYAARLLAANLATSQVAMAVSALMEGHTIEVGNTAAPQSNTLALLVTEFLPAQVHTAIVNNLDPTVYAAEALGLGLADNVAFNAKYVVPFASDIAGFSLAVANVTGVNAGAIDGFVNNWMAFYSGTGAGGHAGLSVTQAAYGAAFGDAVGVALLNSTAANLHTQLFTLDYLGYSPNHLHGLVANALIDIAEGKYIAGLELGDLQLHNALQGEMLMPFRWTFDPPTHDPVALIGIAAPVVL